MFGKKSGSSQPTTAPPPLLAKKQDVATRPQRIEAPPPEAEPPREASPEKSSSKNSAGLDQLRAAQGGAVSNSGPVTEIVREQSDYYHATKTTI